MGAKKLLYLEKFDQLCHGGALLADSHVHAIHAPLLGHPLVQPLLVQNGVDGNGSLACGLGGMGTEGQSCASCFMRPVR